MSDEIKDNKINRSDLVTDDMQLTTLGAFVYILLFMQILHSTCKLFNEYIKDK